MDKRSVIFIILLTLTFFFINTYLFPPQPLPPPQAVVEDVKPKPKPSREKGDLYVIENESQQLVISTLGGTVAEINLPLKSKAHPNSPVRSISADRTLQDEYPQFDHFPSGAYKNFEGTFAEGKIGGYYPLLRRNIDSQFFGLNLSDEPLEKFQVTRLEKNLIELEGKVAGHSVTKTYSLPANASEMPYTFLVDIQVHDGAKGLSLTTGVPEVEIISGSPSPVLQYRYTKNLKPVVEKTDLPKAETSLTSLQPDWICNSNGFFGVILDPIGNGALGFSTSLVPGTEAPTRLTVIDEKYNLYPAASYPGYQMSLPLRPTSEKLSFRVFAGPLVGDVLKTVDQALTDPKTGKGPDYAGAQTFHGWFSFISEPFAKFLFFLMEIFYFVTRSWGVSIILLTVALRAMMYPLNAWSIRATARMQKINPELTALQQRYKKDPKKLQVEMMALYKKNKVNPIGGCFPLLIQMPFLIGMFDLLKSTFELRGAGFIPGWIDNLTAPDVVFSWGYPIWFFGTSFHLLPFILGGIMFVQQNLSSKLPKDRSLWTDQQKQQRSMGNIMTVVFTVLFYHFPSGLNIYWISSLLLGILQQWWTTKNAAVGSVRK